jgi:signal transduction histidine kinase
MTRDGRGAGRFLLGLKLVSYTALLSGGHLFESTGMDSDHLRSIVELVRRIRHDANNPITAAIGHVQLLLDDPAVQDEEVRDSLRVVEGELRRLIEILRRLGEVRMDNH